MTSEDPVFLSISVLASLPNYCMLLRYLGDAV
jgi:hypothetical protein